MCFKGTCDIFYHLETINILDPCNDVHLFCLHYVFLPRINRHLDSWKEAWVTHPLRSKHSMTPEQLWTSGLLGISRSGNHIAKEVFENLNEGGIMDITHVVQGIMNCGFLMLG